MWCLSSANDVMVPASRSPWSSIGTQVCLHKHHKFKHTGLCSKNYSVCKIIAYRTGRYTYMINKNYCIKVQSMNSCHTNDLLECYNSHSAIFWYWAGLLKAQLIMNVCWTVHALYIIDAGAGILLKNCLHTLHESGKVLILWITLSLYRPYYHTTTDYLNL